MQPFSLLQTINPKPRDWAEVLSMVLTAQRAGRPSELLIEDLIEFEARHFIDEHHINFCLRKMAARE